MSLIPTEDQRKCSEKSDFSGEDSHPVVNSHSAVKDGSALMPEWKVRVTCCAHAPAFVNGELPYEISYGTVNDASSHEEEPG